MLLGSMSEQKAPLKIAILGTRGIPARYGGFETFAEELGTRLARCGHEVTVYARRKFGSTPDGPEEYHGVSVRYTPTVMHKYFETPLHSLTSFVDAAFQRFDVILLCNAANSPFAWIGRLCGVPVLINVDGIERRRQKWNALGRLWYRLGEWSSSAFGSAIIADAESIGNYYLKAYGRESLLLSYGAEEQHEEPGAVLAEFKLIPDNYLLYVSRLEPENNALGVIEAYRALGDYSMPLVIVGDAPYADDYKASLRAAAPASVVFTGYQFGAAYRELRSNCYAYVQATEVGGTHPALLEAMAYGNCVIANSVPEHFEVLGGAGLYYERNNFSDLARCFEEVISKPEIAKEYGTLAKQRAEERYQWDSLCDAYEQVLSDAARRNAGA